MASPLSLRVPVSLNRRLGLQCGRSAFMASSHPHVLKDLNERHTKMSDTGDQVFLAKVQQEGRFTFVAIPFSPCEVWGVRPRYPVSGTINDVAVQGTLGALGKDYFLRLAAAWLRASGIEPGAEVTVKLSFAAARLSGSNKKEGRQ
ncbi:DUF1905 domain-containing protein [Candidatus Chloroploca sp. M-50]|nr:DUF1905 domain-containing protein [Candidatus Chloroploca mongolica]MBP1466465.1 DUF1905 domain-containing protein [Candidatus Chloroploca mongolica]